MKTNKARVGKECRKMGRGIDASDASHCKYKTQSFWHFHLFSPSLHNKNAKRMDFAPSHALIILTKVSKQRSTLFLSVLGAHGIDQLDLSAAALDHNTRKWDASPTHRPYMVVDHKQHISYKQFKPTWQCPGQHHSLAHCCCSSSTISISIGLSAAIITTCRPASGSSSSGSIVEASG